VSFLFVKDHPDPKAAKALTVVARIVQKIASIVPPSSADGIVFHLLHFFEFTFFCVYHHAVNYKDVFFVGLMGELESFISKQQVKMKNFIDLICV
jgi:hypothetical protein